MYKTKKQLVNQIWLGVRLRPSGDAVEIDIVALDDPEQRRRIRTTQSALKTHTLDELLAFAEDAVKNSAIIGGATLSARPNFSKTEDPNMLLSPREAAARAGVSRVTVWRAIKGGRLPAEKSEGAKNASVRIKLRNLERWKWGLEPLDQLANQVKALPAVKVEEKQQVESRTLDELLAAVDERADRMAEESAKRLDVILRDQEKWTQHKLQQERK